MWSHATINEGETVCVVSNPGGPRPGGYLDKLRTANDVQFNGEHDRAQKLLEEAIKMVPDHPEALMSAAISFANTKGSYLIRKQ